MERVARVILQKQNKKKIENKSAQEAREPFQRLILKTEEYQVGYFTYAVLAHIHGTCLLLTLQTRIDTQIHCTLLMLNGTDPQKKSEKSADK